MMATRRQAETMVRLRPGGVEDLGHVMRIMNCAFSPTYGEAWTRSQCTGILPMTGVSMTIAEIAGEPAGFSLVRAISDEAELLLLAVDPIAQRRGIGQMLLNLFISNARGVGANRLHLEVRDGNPATSLYLAAGFRPVGRRKNYYHGFDGGTFDAVTLMLAD